MTSRYQKLYGSEHWRRRAKAQMRQEPLCRMCLANSKVTPAQVADHIEKHGGNFNKFRLGALQSLCAACHNSTKSIIEKRGYDPARGWLAARSAASRLPAWQSHVVRKIYDSVGTDC